MPEFKSDRENKWLLRASKQSWPAFNLDLAPFLMHAVPIYVGQQGKKKACRVFLSAFNKGSYRNYRQASLEAMIWQASLARLGVHQWLSGGNGKQGKGMSGVTWSLLPSFLKLC